MKKSFQIFLIVILIIVNSTSCHPIFFGIFQPSTTTESVISDYRHNKRADSSAEHHDIPEMMKKTSHVEFYAEIIGKLIGSVRSGIRTFIDDVKKGRGMNFNEMKNNQTLSQMESIENFLMSENSTSSENTIQFKNHQVSEDLNLIYPSPDTHHHRILGIINEVMLSILSSIANRHNISGQLGFNANLSDTESCKNLISDHATFLEAIRLYKTEKNAKYQQKAKITLQKIFYKYARIYLIARKGYKDYQHSQRDFLKRNMEVDDDNEMMEILNFTTNDARHNFNSIEAVAILILEILGTFFALSIGLWSHLEYYDWIVELP